MAHGRDYREPADKVRENRLRRLAKRMGWRIERSRARILHLNDKGLYQVINDYNSVIEGVDYDADLDRVERALSREQKRLAG